MGGFKKIEVDNSNFGNVVSYEMATELKENIDLLQMAIPVGEIIPILVNLPNVPVPNPDIWQECNGSEIVNPNSPLRTIGIIKNYVPDLRDRYLKVSPNNSNAVGGSQDHSLQHSHATGPASSIGGGLDDKSDRRRRVNHGHQIATQYEEVTTITSPAFYKFVAYMKVV